MNTISQQDPGVQYRCGECGKIVTLRADQPIICQYCGYRIVFKLPTKKIMSYEAI